MVEKVWNLTERRTCRHGTAARSLAAVAYAAFLATGLLFVGGATVLAETALASSWSAGLDQHIESARFKVHYTATPGSANAIAHETAGALLANAEAALAFEVGQLGFPEPVYGDDGKIDISVRKLKAKGMAHGVGSGPSRSGEIAMSTRHAASTSTVAHELFHVIQYRFPGKKPKWIAEATATWVGARASGSVTHTPAYLGRGNRPLLLGPGAGYSQWPFFEYVAERFGPAAILRIFVRIGEQGGSAKNGADVLEHVLGGFGSSLTSEFRGYAATAMTASFTFAPLVERGAPRIHKILRDSRNPRERSQRVSVPAHGAAFVALLGPGPVGSQQAGRCPIPPATAVVQMLSGPDGAPPATLRSNIAGREQVDFGGEGPPGLRLRWPPCDGAQARVAIVNPGASSKGVTLRTTLRVKAPRISVQWPPRPQRRGSRRMVGLKLVASWNGAALIRTRPTRKRGRGVATRRVRLAGSKAKRVRIRLPRRIGKRKVRLTVASVSTSGRQGRTHRRSYWLQ